MRELISVVIPTYNSSSYLLSSIMSVAEQSYRPLEILVVDDGSKDSTPQLLNQVKDKLGSDILFTVIRLEQNTGTANALNVGFSRARGSYVCWLSADDLYIDRDKLMIQWKEMKRTHACWSYYTGSYSGKSPETAIPVRMAGTPIIRFLERVCRTNSELGLLRLLFWNPINGSSVMINKVCTEKFGSFDPLLGRVDADGDLWMRMSALGIRAEPLTGAPVFYRVHPAQTSKKMIEMQKGKELTRIRILIALKRSGKLQKLISKWKWFFILLLIENRVLYTIPYTTNLVLSEMLHDRTMLSRLFRGIILFGIMKSRRRASRLGFSIAEMHERLKQYMSSPVFITFQSLLNHSQQD
ncbi:MAG: glycosyltransferase family 2 protein [Conexivisphaerales archaeon]